MSRDVGTMLDKMAAELRDRLTAHGISEPLMIGIHSGGVWVAEHLHQALKLGDPLGKLDISFYRDDFTRIGLNPAVRPSHLPFTVDGRHIILVDDVLYTGRTIRAALNEIFDYGRPDSVILAVLVDRGGRELPIQPDVTGSVIRLSVHEQVKLSGPAPLELSIKQTP
jgi:pyrimidine operon attenuation protein/uracil phosphoribosyltransferase